MNLTHAIQMARRDAAEARSAAERRTAIYATADAAYRLFVEGKPYESPEAEAEAYATYETVRDACHVQVQR